jgi:xanthine dehydrogenase small subunit
MSDSPRFMLDGELIELDRAEPTRTVLQFLREDRLRVGSKEGCAEGDCGACTVVIAELAGDALEYRAVNACIQFLPTLDGKALFTVESLKAADGSLHPVQQSMVDYHGSQCGFCTPGFIMSMFALYKNNPSPTRADIDDALSGNLCRCTGYRRRIMTHNWSSNCAVCSAGRVCRWNSSRRVTMPRRLSMSSPAFTNRTRMHAFSPAAPMSACG